MSLVLLAVGAVLALLGKIHFGDFHVEGRHVRAAGVVLMLPGAGAFLLMILLAFLFGRTDALYPLLALVYALELLAMIVAVGIAYLLLLNPPNAPKLPGILGEIQAEAQDAAHKAAENGSTKAPSQRQTPRHPSRMHPLQRGAALVSSAAVAPAKPLDRAAYPKIVNLTQAAQYLNTTEEQVRALIDASKLPAVRSGGGYVIAKSVLDELLAEGQVS